jgi:hypothetical protein
MAALALVLAPPAAAGPVLEVRDSADRLTMATELGSDGRWCLVWNHSVTGIEVRDCFRSEAGRLILEASHQPDFAAGLGHIPGRGTTRSDGAGGYWIEGIDAPLPASGLALRRGGPAVGHRIAVGSTIRPLPPGPRGERLTLRLAED